MTLLVIEGIFISREIQYKCMFCSTCNKESKFRYGVKYDMSLCQDCYRKYIQNSSPLKKCECSPECQEMIHSLTYIGKPAKYAWRHWKISSGLSHHGWKGGRRKSGKYMKILRPHHPNSDKKGYVREHRYIMELQIGRYLNRNEVVHHIDGNTRNNNEDNLMLFDSHSKHIKYERPPIDTSNRRCHECGSNKTYWDPKRRYNVWYKRQQGYICSVCRDEERYNLKRKNIWRKNKTCL